jgi:DNA repair protein RecO (recombination protein O)
MEWSDEGFVLSARKHGETSTIVTLLTRDHGRHLGLVRGGSGRRARGLYQPGNRLKVTWRGRLAEHLGSFGCEMIEAVAAPLMGDPLRLAALSSLCAVAEAALPEREPHQPVFDGLAVVLDVLGGADANVWQSVYVKWEIGLLQELGFGLDFSQCAATGSLDNLAFVSPRTGRAVSVEAAGPYRDKLLDLPTFMLSGNTSAPSTDEILAGLRTTGYFLERHVFSGRREAKTPDARSRFTDRLAGRTVLGA